MEKIVKIADSIEEKSEINEKSPLLPGMIKGFASKLSNSIRKFKSSVSSLRGKITAKVKIELSKLLKKVAESLQEFFAHLIVAFFSLAAWVEKLAKEKQFSMNEVTLELSSFESNVLSWLVLYPYQYQK